MFIHFPLSCFLGLFGLNNVLYFSLQSTILLHHNFDVHLHRWSNRRSSEYSHYRKFSFNFLFTFCLVPDQCYAEIYSVSPLSCPIRTN